jgi:large subunit ribosomal protein L21
MYALIEFQGKQYRAEKGTMLKVDRVAAEPGAKIDIDKVLLVSKDDSSVSVGAPYVEGAKVTATVDSSVRDKKVIVFKYIPKKDHRVKKGHRQDYSLLKVEDIVA